MSHLMIKLFGTFEVHLGDQKVTAFSYDKVRALLAYLAVKADQAHARQSLSQALSLLRRAIGDKIATPPYLRVIRQTLQFNADSDCDIDVMIFMQHLAACQAHAHAQLALCDGCLDRLEQAVALYRDDFLTGFSLGDCPAFEDWARLQRERLRRQALETLAYLTDSYLHRDAFDAALRHARRQLALDPTRESAHRQVMRALASGGKRSAALAQYETCCRILTRDLGLDPEAETHALYTAIKAGEQGAKAQQGQGQGIPGASAPGAITSPSLSPHNLPASLTPFVGRAAELRVLQRRLRSPDCRLITLVGPGGSGKTRLAQEAAQPHLAQFPHGVYQVPLIRLQSPAAILPAIGEAIGLVFQAGRDPQRQLFNYLREKSMLLILDNFEHLLEGVTHVFHMLEAATQVNVIITSRVRINAREECLFPISGLNLSDTLDDPAAAAQSDAIQLFLVSAQRVHPDFEPKPDDLWHILRICQLVRGMPLAILLAASWLPMLSPADIAARLLDELTSSLDFLRADWRDVPARQHSLRTVCDQSWRLLTIRERAVFQALSVFRGSFTTQAAERVTGATLRELRSLADKCFIQPTSAGRYEIHEWMRQYAAEKLAQVPAAQKAANDQHSVYYTGALQRWAADLKGARQQGALAEMSQDIENARAAWDWAVAQGNLMRIDRAVQGLCLFYQRHVREQEAEAVCRAAVEKLEAMEMSDPSEGGGHLRILSKMLTWHSRFLPRDQARAVLQRSLALLSRPELEAQDVQREKAAALRQMGHIMMGVDRDEARKFYKQSLALYRASHALWEESQLLRSLGFMAWSVGEYKDARQYHEESLAIARKLEDLREIAGAFKGLSAVAMLLGHVQKAARLSQESLALRRELGDPECAVEFYALASILSPCVEHCYWFWDVAGRHITAAAETLPPDVVEAAQARGRARDVEATVAELLMALET